jgi:hypothetical protein
VLEGRRLHYGRIAGQIVAALDATIGAVESAGWGVIYLDLVGISNLFPGPAALHHAVLGCVPAGLPARLGIAHAKFVAKVGAELGRQSITVLERDAAPFLARQPVDMLPLEPDVLRRLHLLGLHTMGALAGLPRRAVLAQFGAGGVRAWQLAHGVDDEPIQPQPHVEQCVETFTFTDPVTSRPPLDAALHQVVDRAFGRLARRGRAARIGVVRLASERGDCWERSVNFKGALTESRRAWEMVRRLVSEARAPGPISQVILELLDLAPARNEQRLFGFLRGGREQQLTEHLRQITARLGYCPVAHIVELEPWNLLPERRLALVDCNV